MLGADGFSVADAGSLACLHRDFYAGHMGEEHWATTPGSHINRDDAQLEANARLIVAAPAMFEAGVGILDYMGIDNFLDDDRIHPNTVWGITKADLLKLRAALSLSGAPHV